MLDVSQIAPESPRPISRAEYERMVDIGLFEDERIELLYGVLVCMTPQGPGHSSTLQRLNRRLVTAVGDRAAVRIQSPFAASDGSEPEPDAAVVPPGGYDDAHPTAAWLIVEISESSLAKDRGVKADLYAECGVPEYWVVNLVDGLIEVHTQIVRGSYARVVPFRRGERIELQRLPEVALSVSDILRA